MLAGTETLRPGPAYIMGLNPGGDPHAPGYEKSIFDSIQERHEFSCYTDECWQRKCVEQTGLCAHLMSGKVLPEFLVKHQRNMVAVSAALGERPCDIFSANAVFGRSTSRATLLDQTGLSLEQWWEHCWPVHQEFLAIVQPRVVLTLGYGMNSSAFGLLNSKASGPPSKRIGDDNRRGGWTFPARLPLRTGELVTIVIGIPHPSYMRIGPKLSEALTRFR